MRKRQRNRAKETGTVGVKRQRVCGRKTEFILERKREMKGERRESVCVEEWREGESERERKGEGRSSLAFGFCFCNIYRDNIQSSVSIHFFLCFMF